MKQFDIPILLNIFNRYTTTQKVFDRIKQVKPKYLYIAADGARDSHPTDKALCEQTRSIIKQIDWDCQLKTRFRDKNMGCDPAIVDAINWFFSEVEMGIIFEDDCLADKSFFPYCKAMLEKYADNENIMHITGSNFQFGRKHGEASYYFSKLIACWGWATWRRAWKQFDNNKVETVTDSSFDDTLRWISNSPYNQDYWKLMLGFHRKGEDSAWDYRWQYCIWHQRGIGIRPNVNLVKNIGFDSMATHSGKNSERDILSEIPERRIENILHPQIIEINQKADEFTHSIFNPPLYVRRWRKLLRIIDEKINYTLKRIWSISPSPTM